MWVKSGKASILMSEQLVTLKLQGSVAVLSLNRPARHNALVPELLTRLIELLADDRCRLTSAVILRAEGRSFSTGGDLLGFKQHRATIRDYANELVGLLNQAILTLYQHPVPVICAVHGQVTGGSLGFLLASGRVVMRRSATITPWYSEVGFSPDGGWTAMLPDVIGRQQCMHWLSTNASYNAETCQSLGLVQEVVEDDCDTAALRWAHQAGAVKSGSVACSRLLINSKISELKSKLNSEREQFVRQVQLPEAWQGIEQFLKRGVNHA